MKVIYDQETDTLTLILRAGKVIESDEIRDGIIVDYDKNGKAISLEFINASNYIVDPWGIAYELKGRKVS